MTTPVILATTTDQSIAGILAHGDRQLLRADVVTLTRAQWHALLGEMDRRRGVRGLEANRKEE